MDQLMIASGLFEKDGNVLNEAGMLCNSTMVQ